MDDNLPTRKVSFGAAAGAAVTLLVWIFNKFVLPDDKHITPEIAAALTTLVMFLVGYFTRDPSPEPPPPPRSNEEAIPPVGTLQLKGTYIGDTCREIFEMLATLRIEGDEISGDLDWKLADKGKGSGLTQSQVGSSAKE